MALKKTFTLVGKSQISGDFWTAASKEQEIVAECLVKVVSISSNKESAIALVNFTASNLNGIKNYTFTPNMDGVNFIKQAYEHLKTLPEFLNAIDC